MSGSIIRSFKPLAIGKLVLIVAICLPHVEAYGLPANKISQLAKSFTVLINSQSPGTGVILNKKGKTYTVLTAAHVVEYSDYEYEVQTPDQSQYPISYKTVKKLPGVDLAILEFSSDKSYPTARIADSDETVEGSPVYIAGFPDPGTATEARIFQFTSGEVSARPTQGPKGYLMHYTNITRFGMSGGPVLIDQGRLVGIHGLANTDQDSGNKTGINLGIPINSFLDLSTKVGFNPKVLTPASASTTTVSRPTSPSNPSPIVPRPIPIRPTTIGRPKPIRPGSPTGGPVCAGFSC